MIPKKEVVEKPTKKISDELPGLPNEELICDYDAIKSTIDKMMCNHDSDDDLSLYSWEDKSERKNNESNETKIAEKEDFPNPDADLSEKFFIGQSGDDFEERLVYQSKIENLLAAPGDDEANQTINSIEAMLDDAFQSTKTSNDILDEVWDDQMDKDLIDILADGLRDQEVDKLESNNFNATLTRSLSAIDNNTEVVEINSKINYLINNIQKLNRK